MNGLIVKHLKEGGNSMQKDDVRVGYILMIKEGLGDAVIPYLLCEQQDGDKFLLGQDDTWFDWNEYSTTLRCKYDSTYDVLEVYGLPTEPLSDVEDLFGLGFRECLWSRGETVRLTYEELEIILGYSVEITARFKDE